MRLRLECGGRSDGAVCPGMIWHSGARTVIGNVDRFRSDGAPGVSSAKIRREVTADWPFVMVFLGA